MQQNSMESGTSSSEDSSLFGLKEAIRFIGKNKNNSSNLINSVFADPESQGNSAATLQNTSGDCIARGMLSF